MGYLKDPITKQPSVALTLLVLSSVLMVGGIIMECFTAVRSTRLLDEFFGAAMTLYGGHIFAFKDCINDGNFPQSHNEIIPAKDIEP